MPVCMWGSTRPGNASSPLPSTTLRASSAGISRATLANLPSLMATSDFCTELLFGRTRRTFLTSRSYFFSTGMTEPPGRSTTGFYTRPQHEGRVGDGPADLGRGPADVHGLDAVVEVADPPGLHEVLADLVEIRIHALVETLGRLPAGRAHRMGLPVDAEQRARAGRIGDA